MTQFPPLPNYSEEQKTESNKNFYNEYILGNQINKKDIKKLGELLEKASNFLLINPDRQNDVTEVFLWNSIDSLIKAKISPKLYSDVYNKITSTKAPSFKYIFGENDNWGQKAMKIYGNVNLNTLNNAAARLPFLKALHSCLETGGLPTNYETRDPFFHKKYNVRISPMGILDKYEFFLNEKALKSIIKAHIHQKPMPFKGKYIPYDYSREIEITSTLLKEDEVSLFLSKNGVNVLEKKNWRKYNSDDFFKYCDKEPNILYDYPDFHPLKPTPKEESFLDSLNLVNLDKLLIGSSLGNENFNNRQIIKRPNNTKKEVPVGTYRAIIIGIDEYKLLQNLKYPISDAKKIKELLELKYGFVGTLFLENPTRNEIIDAFDILEEELKTGDNLLIFYAGHGYRDANKGYWMPKDAHSKRRSNWIENSTILTYFERLDKCQHILLIDDSCFSGSWLETRKPNINTLNKTHSVLYQAKSRIVLTSGAKNEEVLDKSEFFAQIFKELKENDNDSFDIVSSFGLIQSKVIAINPNQKPQCGKLPSKSDEGGSLILYKKKNH